MNNFDGNFAILLDLILKGENEALGEAFPVEEFHDFAVLLFFERFADTFEALSPYVSVL